jgi:hypothetical protein
MEVAMKSVLGIVMTVFLVSYSLWGQLGHIAPCSGSGSHVTPNCYGYAIGRAGEKYSNDEICTPQTLGLDRAYLISGTYFDVDYDASLTNLINTDVVFFNDHAAYVTSVDRGTPLNSTVSHWWQGVVESKTVLQLTQNPYNLVVQGYARRKQISVQVRNNFDGGIVDINGGQVSAGPHDVDWWGNMPLTVVDFQTIYSKIRRFKQWNTPGEVQTTATITFPIRGGTYYAICDSLYEITFQNSFPWSSGGTIKVNDTSRSTPFIGYTVQKVPPAQTIKGEATYQVLNYFEYTFSS